MLIEAWKTAASKLCRRFHLLRPPLRLFRLLLARIAHFHAAALDFNEPFVVPLIRSACSVLIFCGRDIAATDFARLEHARVDHFAARGGQAAAVENIISCHEIFIADIQRGRRTDRAAEEPDLLTCNREINRRIQSAGRRQIPRLPWSKILRFAGSIDFNEIAKRKFESVVRRPGMRLCPSMYFPRLRQQ